MYRFNRKNIMLTNIILFFFFSSFVFADTCWWNEPWDTQGGGTWSSCFTKNGKHYCGSSQPAGYDNTHKCIWQYKNGQCSCLSNCPAGEFFYNGSCVTMNDYMAQTLDPNELSYYQTHCKTLFQSAYADGKEICWDKVICDGHSKSVSVSCGSDSDKGQKYLNSNNQPVDNNLSSPSCVGALVYDSQTGSVKCLDKNQSSFIIPDYKYTADAQKSPYSDSNNTDVSSADKANSYSNVLLSSSANNLAFIHQDLQSLNSKVDSLSNTLSNVANLQSSTLSTLGDISQNQQIANSKLDDIGKKIDTTNKDLGDISQKMNVLNDINKTFSDVNNFSNNHDILSLIKDSVNSATNKYSNHSFVTSAGSDSQQCQLKYSFTIAGKTITINLQDFIDSMPLSVIKGLLYFFASLGIFYSCIRTD